MSGKAKSGRFMDTAHARYDVAIWKQAAKSGFSRGNAEVSLIYYSLEYIKEKKAGYHKSGGGVGKVYTGDGKKPCFLYNKELGCTRDAKTCSYGHWCSRCGSRTHIRADCKKDWCLNVSSGKVPIIYEDFNYKGNTKSSVRNINVGLLCNAKDCNESLSSNVLSSNIGK